jgi:hypothetical protein
MQCLYAVGRCKENLRDYSGFLSTDVDYFTPSLIHQRRKDTDIEHYKLCLTDRDACVDPNYAITSGPSDSEEVLCRISGHQRAVDEISSVLVSSQL